MKQFIVNRHTDPSNPTLDEVPTEKVPVYDTEADAVADLSNLEEGQIGFTKDTGNELAQPVDVVEEDNLHAVTSNAVFALFKDCLKKVDKSKSFTLGANDDANVTFVLDAISGYKPLFMREVYASNLNNSNALVIEKFYMSNANNTATVTLGNRSSSQQLTGTLQVSVVYVKEDMCNFS